MRHRLRAWTTLGWLFLLVLSACGNSDGIDGALTGTPTVPSSPPANPALQRQGAEPLATFRKVNDWGSGFIGEVTITNSTTAPIVDWKLRLTTRATLGNIWNATLQRRDGDVLWLSPQSYNQTIAVGQSITLGFQASPGGSQTSVDQVVLEWPGAPPSPPPETPPAPPAVSAGEVRYQVTSNWGTGFVAQIELKNPSGVALQNWRLRLRLPAEIDNIWNAVILERQGDLYLLGPASWNRTLPAQGTLQLGFQGHPGGAPAQATELLLTSDTAVPPSPNPSPTPPAEPTPPPTPSPTPTPPSDPHPEPPAPPAPGFLRTQGARLVDSQGRTVILRGLNWFGMETETFAPHGLWTRSMDSMLDQMASLGYDTLRIPFSNEAWRPQSVPNGIDFSKNPDLVGKRPIEILDILVEKAGRRGIRLILDRHRPNRSSQSELWYTPEVSEEQWIQDWEMLARRYRGNPTVIGADLHNEPHGRATWGSGDPATDWRLAAQRAGNRILAVNPDWLIVVEGIETFQGHSTWWGGNLRGVASHPVVLNVPHRVVYSPHEYATSVHPQPWFFAPNYPANLTAIWDANWGYILKQDLAPILLGEFGTTATSPIDQVWLAEIVDYLADHGASFTYWCWNPNSRDTGGLLRDDWNTIDSTKQNALLPLLRR